MHRRLLAGLLLASAMLGAAHADEKTVRIGVLNDQTGMAADLAGPGTVVAVKLAVEDFGSSVLGKPIEVVIADHQNKPDTAAQIASAWYDVKGVDMIIDLPNSSTALAAFEVAKARKKVVIATAAISSLLAGEKCIDTGFQFTTDTYSLARGVAKGIVSNGGKDWFFITADYAFGNSLDKDASDAVREAGGKVLGRVRHPFGVADFSSYLVTAQSSGAKVIGLANGAGDLVNSMKQGSEFGIAQGGQQLAAFLVYISDVHSMGLDIAKGTRFVDTFYWDQNDATRAWSKRFMNAFGGRAPTQVHAAAYSAVTHYLKAVKAAGSVDGPAVAAKMREIPVDDFYTHGVKIRPDNRVVRDHFLWEVKAPAESKYPYDYFKLITTVPGDQLVKPVGESDCPLVKKS
ncbi:ABC transporter permease [Bradyrhizobium sp. AS23.2]|nr:ABC transporter permease [Bradyrhizobium sp. AS23.2]